MKFRIISFEGCPNATPIQELIEQVSKDLGVEPLIEQIRVSTDQEAVEYRMLGSPTVLINGQDIDPAAQGRSDYAMSCRVFHGPNGLPPRSMLERAINGQLPQQSTEQ